MTEDQNQEVHPSTETTPPSAEEELREYKEKCLRLLADMDNTRKRMQKEKQDATKFALENLIVEMLSPIDNLENALQFTDRMSDETRNWAQGFSMILAQFKDVLSHYGVASLSSEGKAFDPQLHHAIETEETLEHPPGTILKEFVKGYRSGERTIRHSRVKVSILPGTTNKQEPDALSEPLRDSEKE